MVNLTMFTQPYFFTDMLFFKFTLFPQTYISSYSFKADVRIMTSSKTQFLEPPFFNESLSAIEVVPGEKMNKFTKLSDATTYMVDIYYKENFCEESYFDFLGSHPICTSKWVTQVETGKIFTCRMEILQNSATQHAKTCSTFMHLIALLLFAEKRVHRICLSAT